MKKKRHIGRKASSFELYDELGPITGVVLLLDDNNEIVAGSEDGYVLRIDCKYGTQTMADNILEAVEGRTYKGFRAAGTLLDPMAELGDGVTVVDTYSILAYRSVNFGPGHMSEIAAPGESTLEHEYQYKSPTQRQTDRKIAQTISRIAKTAEEIRLEVANELEGMSASIILELDSVKQEIVGLENAYSEMELSLYGLTTRVQDAEGNIADLELTTQEFGVSISDLEGDYAELVLTLDGLTVTDDEGTTRIKGSSIETDTLYVNAANVAGTLDAGSVDVNGELCLIYDGEIYGYFGANWYSSVGAHGVALLDPTALNGLFAFTSGVKIQCGTQDNQIYLAANGKAAVVTNGKYYYIEEDHFSPGGHAPTLGTSALLWGQIYSTNSAISTSDREKKNSIVYDMDARYDTLWNLLKPCTGKYNDGTSDRVHMFLISQDVEDAIAEAGLTNQDFAAFIKSPKQDKDGNVIDGYDYALRYEEFIPLCIRQIQKLQARVAELEVRNA